MSFRLLSLMKETSTEPFVCIYCGNAIEPGSDYLHEKSVFNEVFQDQKWHPECLKAHADSGDIELTPYRNERPK